LEESLKQVTQSSMLGPLHPSMKSHLGLQDPLYSEQSRANFQSVAHLHIPDMGSRIAWMSQSKQFSGHGPSQLVPHTAEHVPLNSHTVSFQVKCGPHVQLCGDCHYIPGAQS
jgi:hypothetical protein